MRNFSILVVDCITIVVLLPLLRSFATLSEFYGIEMAS
jgi:hypothetical protein